MKASIFPDSESLLVQYLALNMPGIHVGTDVPNPRPDSTGFIRLLRTGGPSFNLVADGPQITMEAWHEEAEQAYVLIAQARALINKLPATVFNDVAFYKLTEFTGPQQSPDPESDIHRYVWTFRIGVRGTEA